MHIILILINLVVFLGLLSFLIYWQKKQINFSVRVLSSTAIGLIYGAILHMLYSSTPILGDTIMWTSLIGTSYVHLLKMIVVPLIFVAIVSSIMDMFKHYNIGGTISYILFALIGTTAIASAIGVLSTYVFQIDASRFVHTATVTDRAQTLTMKFQAVSSVHSILDKIMQMIPSNIFLEMTGANPTSTIAVVVFSALLGLAGLRLYKIDKSAGEKFHDFVSMLQSIIMSLTRLVINLTPYGVLSLMASFMAKSNWAVIGDMAKFVGAIYAALFVMFCIHTFFIVLLGINPLRYIKKTFPALIYAFSSRSSMGTIPINILVQTKAIGNQESTASLAASLGATIGQNGCAGIYPAVLATMVAPTVGINPFTIAFISKLVIIIAISSFGIAGVGAGGTFAALVVLSAMGLPIELAGILIAIEGLVDMGRTALNVNGAMFAGTFASKMTQTFDSKVFANTHAISFDLENQ